MKIRNVKTPREIEEIRHLFLEYERNLGVDLSFQDFEEELSSLPGKYAPPEGALLIAVEGHTPAGCVAIRKLEDSVCEMKRLFVRPSFRGRGIGRNLAEKIIEKADKLGYDRMRLDTLERLKEAVGIYESMGFKRIEPYYHNPLPDVVYWELDLKAKRY